MGFQEFF